MPVLHSDPAHPAIPATDWAARPARPATRASAVTVQWRTGGASWPPLAGTATRQAAQRQTAIGL
jgi:hypothetical protein